MARHKPIAVADLDQLVAAITVDAYGDDEPQTAFVEVFSREVRLPAAATVLGMPVDVVGFDYHDERLGIVARCRRDGARQDLAMVDLFFPPDTVAAWLHAAYRRWLGPPVARPGPASVRHAGRLAAVVAAGHVASAATRRRLAFLECRVE